VIRPIEFIAAGTMLVLCAPLMAALGLAVRIDSPGPVLFVQTRVGRARRPIRVVKLRTMVAGADRIGLGVTASRDPRITRVGSFLRRTKLDELPQLWNILLGDMSFVGPRPELPVFVDRYPPEWEPILAIRPGLTDTASLIFRDEERLLEMAEDRERAYTEVLMPLKARLVLEDLRHRSWLYDMSVIARTVAAVVRPRDPASEPIILEASERIQRMNTRPRT
jgi:lipopolysaccharide/colanic/teichoic acid biosynthesis glycosyltransferase